MELGTKWVAIALIILLGSLGVVGVALTRNNSTTPTSFTTAPARNNSTTPTSFTTAPLSSAYLQYQQNKSAGTLVTHTPDGHGLGYAPPPVELPSG